MSKSKRQLRQEIAEDSQFSDDDDDSSRTIAEEAIFMAIIENDVIQLQKILDQGAHLDFCNHVGEGPLHTAVSQDLENEDTTVLDLLLFFGCPLTRQNRFGETPLHVASRASPKYVEHLLNAGAPVNVRDNAGRTALMLACGSMTETALVTVQYLLDRGAGIHYQDQEGQTALHYLCKQYSGQKPVQAEIMYKLLYAGLNVNIQDHQGISAAVYIYATPNILVTDKNNENSAYKLLRVIIQGGASVLEEQLKTLSGQQNRLANRLPRRMFRIFMGSDLSMYEPVTSRATCTKLYSLYKLTFPEESKSSVFAKAMKKMLLRSRVESMKELSRLVIRDRLNGCVFSQADKLGLPTTLESYVKYSDCV